MSIGQNILGRRMVDKLTVYTKLGSAYVSHAIRRKLSVKLNKIFTKPFSLHLLVTSRCNLRCKMCSCWMTKDFDMNLTTAEWKNVIDQASEWKIPTITFGGGEPLLRDDIFELIDYATSKGIICSIITNGTMINEDNAERLVTKLFRIAVSLDGPNPVDNDNIRGVDGSFDRAVKGLQLLAKIKKEKRLSTMIYIQCTILKDNVDKVLEVVELAEKLGIKFLCQPYLPKTKLQNTIEDANLAPSPEDMEKLINKLKDVKRTKNIILNPTQHLDFTADVFNNKIEKINCLIGYNTVGVGPDGDVWSCPMSFICKSERLGNIRDNTLKEIWKSEKANNARKAAFNCTKKCAMNVDLPSGKGRWFIRDLIKAAS